MREKNVLFCLILLICMAAAFVVTLGYPSEARFFPLIVISLGGIAVIWELVRAYRQRDKASSGPDKENRGKFAFAAAWVVAFTLGLWVLGFNIGLPLFSFAYVKTHEQAGDGRLYWP